jgi:hypothetical protein
LLLASFFFLATKENVRHFQRASYRSLTGVAATGTAAVAGTGESTGFGGGCGNAIFFASPTKKTKVQSAGGSVV